VRKKKNHCTGGTWGKKGARGSGKSEQAPKLGRDILKLCNVAPGSFQPYRSRVGGTKRGNWPINRDYRGPRSGGSYYGPERPKSQQTPPSTSNAGTANTIRGRGLQVLTINPAQRATRTQNTGGAAPNASHYRPNHMWGKTVPCLSPVLLTKLGGTVGLAVMLPDP